MPVCSGGVGGIEDLLHRPSSALQPTAGRVSQTNRLDNRFLQHAHQAEREIVFVFVHSCIFIFVHSYKCVHHGSSLKSMILMDGEIHQLLSSSSCAWIYWFQALVAHGSIDGDTHGQGRNTILLWKLLTNKTKFPLDQAVEHRWFFVKKIRKIISINLFEI